MQKLSDALWIALSMVPLGALAGLAALLRSSEPMTPRAVAAALLNSGILAGALCALMFHWLPGAILFNVGMSALAGLGGNTAVGFALKAWQSFLAAQLKGESDE